MRWLLASVMVLAFLLRMVALSSYPAGFTPDEASLGYDAYSLYQTGKDQWGESFPLSFRSFGDFKLPLYTYLTIPTVAIFGLNEFAVRLPNALLGTLAVLATYLMALELFKSKRLENGKWKIEILAALLLAISPWHISLSRGAFEANLTTFFMPLGVWAFLKGVDKPKWMLVAALAFGLNLFSYHSARLVSPLLILGLIWWQRRSLFAFALERYKWAIGVFVVFFLVAGYTMLTGAGARGSDIAIFNPTDRWAGVADRRYEVVLQGFPDSLARIFSNKVVYTLDQFINRYLTYVSPKFLFAEGAAEWTYGMIPGRGTLYLIEVPFVLTAIWWAIRGRVQGLGIIFLWILLAPIPAALAKGEGFAGNRVAVMIPALQVLSAYGAVVFYGLLAEKWPKFKKILLYIFITALLASLAVFLEDYRYHAPLHGTEAMHFGKREAVLFTESVNDQYKEIVFSRSLSEPHIFVGFYSKWDPDDYQKHTPDWLRYEEEGRSFLDQLGEYRLGKYVFRSINYSQDKEASDTLLVGKPNEFPEGVSTIHEVIGPGGNTVILVVDPQK